MRAQTGDSVTAALFGRCPHLEHDVLLEDGPAPDHVAVDGPQLVDPPVLVRPQHHLVLCHRNVWESVAGAATKARAQRMTERTRFLAETAMCGRCS